MESYSLIKKEYNIESIRGLKNIYRDVVEINNKFLLFRSKINEISIFDLNNNLILIGHIKEKDNILYFTFHPYYGTILFVCVERNIIVYGIEAEKQKISKLSIIKGHFTNVEFISSNPLKPNIFLSISIDNNIKVFDISSALPVSHIFLDEEVNNEIKWGKNHIGFLNNNTIIYFNYINFERNNTKKFTLENINDFFFYSNDELVIIKNDNNILIVKNDKIIFSEKLNSNKTIYEICYNNINSTMLLIYVDEIIGIKFNKIYNFSILFNFKLDKTLPFFINNNYFELKEEFTLYGIRFPYITSYSIINNQNQHNNNEINLKNDKDNFIKNIMKNISDISLLISTNNNSEKILLKNKKYFEIDEIKSELNIIKTRNLLLRKEEVEKKIKEFKSIKGIKEQYIFLVKLLINDNTNKELLLIYLNFIKKNEKKLIGIFNNNVEEFNDELDYYSLIFTKDENKNYFNISQFSPKEELFNFLDSILSLNSNNLNDIKKFENILNSCEKYFDNISYFNMPIDFSNEQFFYYRNNNLIKYYLKNLSIIIKNKDNESKNEENEENESENEEDEENEEIEENESVKEGKRNKFEKEENEKKKENKGDEKNQEIIKRELTNIQNKLKLCIDAVKNLNDPEKINYLIILIIKSSSFEEFTYGYNLITSNKIKDSDLNNYLSEIEQKRKEKEKNKIKSKISKIAQINYQYLCLKNIELSDEIYNYEYYKKNYPEDIDISLIKDFFKTVLPLECFKSIYLELFGKDAYYPFLDKRFTNDFVEKNFEFIPMYLDNSLGLSDKFTLKTYFVSFLPEIKGKCNEIEKTALKIGSLVNTGNHETGHNFFSIRFYMENCQTTIVTPRKNSLEFSEGGSYVELALFGRILEEINLEQALYILNEKNYNKTYLQFQEGFNKIKIDDLKVDGIFKTTLNGINLDEKFIKISKAVFIEQKKLHGKNEKKISYKIRNDVIGKIISDESYKKIMEKYT